MAADSKPISREWIARALSAVEDIVYAGLGLLLAASAIALMIHGAYTVFQDLANGALPQNITVLLDRNPARFTGRRASLHDPGVHPRARVGAGAVSARRRHRCDP